MDDILDQEDASIVSVHKYKSRVVIIWGVVVLFGAFLKIMHWPGSGFLILIGFAGLAAYSLIGLSLYKTKTQTNLTSLIVSGFWLAYLLYSSLIEQGDSYNTKALALYAISAAIFFLIYFLAFRIKKTKKRDAPSRH